MQVLPSRRNLVRRHIAGPRVPLVANGRYLGLTVFDALLISPKELDHLNQKPAAPKDARVLGVQSSIQVDCLTPTP